MRNQILVGFLSLWVFSILAPSVITLASNGEETLMILCHNEEEQQETGKKDSVEEKIIPEYKDPNSLTHHTEDIVPGDKYTQHSSNYVVEIHLPPPEQGSAV